MALRGRNVVLVTDRQLADDWKSALLREGVQVSTVSSLKELVDRAADLRGADLLIADVELPDGRITDALEPLSVIEPADVEALVACVRQTIGRTRPAQPAPAPARSCLDVLGAAGLPISRTRLPVLLHGETGTGKSHLVRALHQALTPEAPFVEVNAASLSGNLFCSEMFGYERGAFTGAATAKPGLVAMARGGSLFLDEIADLPLDAQAHLLSFLDSGRYRPLGAVREQSSDARIFAATHRDLPRLVEEGRFREDLYYRLANIIVSLPPLRERVAELPRLIAEILATIGERYQVAPRLDPEALEALVSFHWPGNLRQLRFVLESLLVSHLDGPIPATAVRKLLPNSPSPRSAGETLSLADAERELVRAALDKTRGNRTEAARLLGITPRGLYNKVRRYGLAA